MFLLLKIQNMYQQGQSQLASATLRKIFEKRFGWGEKILFFPGSCVYFLSYLVNLAVCDSA